MKKEKILTDIVSRVSEDFLFGIIIEHEPTFSIIRDVNGYHYEHFIREKDTAGDVKGAHWKTSREVFVHYINNLE